MQIFLRQATKNDLPSVLRLYAQPDMDDGKILNAADAERVFDRMGRYPNYRLYVAVTGQQIVGSFALLVMDNLAHQGTPSAIVEDVVVDSSHHGQGIGKFMMQHAIKIAQSEACYKLMLSSNIKRQRAHRFYESLGFERHGYSFRIDISCQPDSEMF